MPDSTTQQFPGKTIWSKVTQQVQGLFSTLIFPGSGSGEIIRDVKTAFMSPKCQISAIQAIPASKSEIVIKKIPKKPLFLRGRLLYSSNAKIDQHKKSIFS